MMGRIRPQSAPCSSPRRRAGAKGAASLHTRLATRIHMTNILSKLGVHTRMQALVLAARHGVVKIR